MLPIMVAISVVWTTVLATTWDTAATGTVDKFGFHHWPQCSVPRRGTEVVGRFRTITIFIIAPPQGPERTVGRAVAAVQPPTPPSIKRS
jgi:hypothetical protein